MKITKHKYKSLQEIKQKIEYVQKLQDKYVAQAEKITGDKHGNRTYDWLLNDYGDLDLLLYHLDIEVKP